MARSVSSRVKRVFFTAYSLSVLLVLLVAWVALEDLEATTVAMDKQAEIEHFRNRHETDRVLNIQSALVTLTFLPVNSSQEKSLPVIFRGLPVPFEDEINFLDKEYTIIIQRIPEGTFYFAKDLSIFTQRENLMVAGLLTLGLLLLLLGFGLSQVVSRMISRPIQDLSRDILQISQSNATAQLSEAYEVAELNQISGAFNHYLEEIGQLIERERSLISMASHELRTPIAVILGAAQVLERRQQLQPDDRITLQRIISSAEVMSSNVQALLALVRRSKNELPTEACSIAALVHEVLADITCFDSTLQQRITFNAPANEVIIETNPALARMLLHNLISNALNHNLGTVTIALQNTGLEVRDAGLPRSPELGGSLTTDSTASTGLGLYIVTLICAQLNWKFNLRSSDRDGTLAQVLFQAAA